MKTKIINLLLIIPIFIFLNSCDRPACKNVNPTFYNFKPGSKEYKRELAQQIESIGTENLSYWFDRYLKKDGKEFIIIDIQGARLCAKGELEVKNWDKIIGTRREISGYHGAELRGLKVRIEQDSAGTNLIYHSVEKVID